MVDGRSNKKETKSLPIQLLAIRPVSYVSIRFGLKPIAQGHVLVRATDFCEEGRERQQTITLNLIVKIILFNQLKADKNENK